MLSERQPQSLHRRLNDALTVLVVFLVGYIFLWPWLPSIGWQFRDHKIEQQLERTVEKVEVPTGRRLLVPSLNLNEEIYDGPNEDTLMKGLWRRPGTGDPESEGNTVIAGHRFIYSSEPAIFYHLDKIKMSDKLYIAWNNTLYSYEVNDIFVVAPKEVWIEERTAKPTLTLYTCTPLWTSNQRLVIRAVLDNVQEGI